jgi:hypothetical protein
MSQKDSQAGKLSRTEKDIDVLIRQAPRATEAVPKKPLGQEVYRWSYILSSVIVDVVFVPWMLVTMSGWMWVFIAPVILIPLALVQYRTYMRFFAPRPIHRHSTSNLTPQFQAAEGEEKGPSEGHDEP